MVGPPSASTRPPRGMRDEAAMVQSTPEITPQTSGSGCLMRLLWMIGGNALVALSGIYIALGKGGYSPLDALYWGGVFLLAGARLIDIAYFDGRTADGAPATMRHGVRFAIVVFVLSTAFWLVAHAVAG